MPIIAPKRPMPEVAQEALVVRPAVFDRKPKPAPIRSDADTEAQEALIADFAAANGPGAGTRCL